MECRRARELLWPPERPRLVEGEVARARTHLDRCEACRSYLAQDRALLDAYFRARRLRAPFVLRKAVFDALSNARWVAGAGRKSRARRSWARLAAGAVVAGALGWIAHEAREHSDPDAPEGAAMFAEDYLRRAVGQDYVVTSDPSEIRRFVQRELGLSFEPSQVAGLTLRRAEACLIRGRRGAMIVYERNGTVISHYLVPREGARPRTPTVSDYHEVPGGGRMPVVTWSTTSVDQALVGDVEVDVLLEIARSGAT